jgi:hypothetical protein
MFLSPHVAERQRGLALLLGSEATRRSVLTAHLLAARVVEPEAPLRAAIVRALCGYFERRELVYRYPSEVRAQVVAELRRLGRAALVALLELQIAEAADEKLNLPDGWWLLFDRVPHAATLLARLVSDRDTALPLRQAALTIIARVGFTEARPALLGLEARLAGNAAGQLTMNFAPPAQAEDGALWPLVRETLRKLNE